MNNEGVTKAPKDKNCPYCGQSFTSSSLGRHLDLYIKEKNPKAPDGIHDVDEIRKIRGGITRRQPRGGSRRDTGSGYRGSQGSLKRDPGDSDGESNSVQSPGDGNSGYKGSHSHRTYNRQVLKTSVDAKQKFQDALDTAKAAELALREMIGSWRAAKHQVNLESMPFEFSPMSLDFPALCLQCLEPPPSLFSSMPQPTTSSWSVAPPGEDQKEAVWVYLMDGFRKWKSACNFASAAGSATGISADSREPSTSPSQSNGTRATAHRALARVELVEKSVLEHLNSVYAMWTQLSPARQQEIWVLEMARAIGRKQKEVDELKQARQSLRQENSHLKSQIDLLNQDQQTQEFKVVPPMTMRIDERLAELWIDAGSCGADPMGLNLDDQQQDLGAVVAGAIERWKGVVVASRASGMAAQRSLDQALHTPMSTVHPMSPETSRPMEQAKFQHGLTQASPNSQASIVGRNRSVSAAAAMVMNRSRVSAVSTPAHSPADLQEDADIDPEDEEEDEDADGEADVDMEEENDYLSAATTPTHHTISHIQSMQQQQQQRQHHHQIARPQTHPMHPSVRPQAQQHIPTAAVRHPLYSTQRQRGYGAPPPAAPVVLASQPMQQQHHHHHHNNHAHMTPQSFGHQLQSLEHHLSSSGWGSPSSGGGGAPH